MEFLRHLPDKNLTWASCKFNLGPRARAPEASNLGGGGARARARTHVEFGGRGVCSKGPVGNFLDQRHFSQKMDGDLLNRPWRVASLCSRSFMHTTSFDCQSNRMSWLSM